MSSRTVKKQARRPTAADASAIRPPGPRRTGRVPALLLILAIVLTFWPVCAHEFTNWDDDLNVTQNAHLYNPSAGGLLFFWGHAYEHEYIPLSYTGWWLLARIARLETPDSSGTLLNPYVFHTANLLLHVAAALIAYRLLQLLTGRRWPAFAGALLFALHPLQVEPVAWVTGLKDLLCGLLSIVALWQYVLFAGPELSQSAKDDDAADAMGRRHWSRGWHYAAATLALGAAIIAKPSAVTVPALAAAIDLWVLRRPVRRVALALAPWAAIAAGFAIAAMRAMPGAGAATGSAWMRPLVASDTVAFYLGKVLLPWRLAAIYPHSVKQVLAGDWIGFVWLAPAGLVAVAWVSRRRAAWVAAAVAIFVAAILPVSGLVSFEYETISTVADRYAYVAMLGPALALAFALTSPWLRRSPRRVRWAAAACGAGLALLAAHSFAQTGYWRDSNALFRHAIDVAPSSDVAYCNLAADALVAGRPDEAERLARQAIDIDPHRAQNYVTLGIILQSLGRHADAGVAFLQASQLDPGNTKALINLAAELAHAGQVDKAAAICHGVLQIEPEFAEAHRCMATLLSLQHRDQDAVGEAELAVRLGPSNANGYITLGQMLERAGRRAEAAEQFSTALSMSPNSADARDGLARTAGALR